MRRTIDHRGSTGTGGKPPVPPDLDPIAADEGPMRGELKRQIEALESEIAQFIVANCPYEEVPKLAERGPAVLTTAELEFVRDELLQLQADLHERLVGRMAERMGEAERPEPEVAGLFERLRRRLRERMGA